MPRTTEVIYVGDADSLLRAQEKVRESTEAATAAHDRGNA
jgi:hypothetical protein